MPIKFRCNYCRQFLGISRAQAGGIVDCPTCGRSIRVPMLDGTLQPIPQPELNLQDAHLSRALDELARLANPDSSPEAVVFDRSVDQDEEAENEIPQLIPEPIPIEVPIPPTPISIRPAMQDADDDESIGDEAPVSAGTPAATVARYDVLAELAKLPPVDLDEKSSLRQSPRSVELRPPREIASIWKTALCVAGAFVGGMLFERLVKVFESAGPKPNSVVTSTDEGSAKASDSSQVTGRVTYKSADGTSQPDRGARIIAFPLQREGEAKLSAVGFRAADAEADARVAAAALKAMGGGMATADDSGQFRLAIPAGSYQLLILSHFQSRDEKQETDPALQKLLATYFDKPDEVLGRVKYDFSPLRAKGTGDVRDQSF